VCGPGGAAPISVEVKFDMSNIERNVAADPRAGDIVRVGGFILEVTGASESRVEYRLGRIGYVLSRKDWAIYAANGEIIERGDAR
jgi:hypothetical protein